MCADGVAVARARDSADDGAAFARRGRVPFDRVTQRPSVARVRSEPDMAFSIRGHGDCPTKAKSPLRRTERVASKSEHKARAGFVERKRVPGTAPPRSDPDFGMAFA